MLSHVVSSMLSARADYAAAGQMLDASLRGVRSARGRRDLGGVLAHGEPVSVEVIGCNVFTNASGQGTTRTTSLSYQIDFRDPRAACLATEQWSRICY